MKQLVEHIKQSIYGPAYYRELLSRPLSFSCKYFFALALFLALVLTIAYSVPLVPKILEATREFPAAFFAYYPDQLEITINKGIVSSNVAEPYFLPTPEAFKGGVGPLLVIDTKTPFSTAQFKEYKVAAWLGRDQVALLDRGGSIRVEPFDAKMDVTINEELLRGLEQKFQPFYKFAAPTLVLVIFLGLFIVFCFSFIYLVVGAVFIFFLGRLMRVRFTYGASYRIGLHATTLPLILSSILSTLNLPVSNFPFLYSAVMLAVVFVNFKGNTSALTPLAPLKKP